MQTLPKWALLNPLPAIYDFESVTPLQQTARVYGAMQEMIREYNAFAEQLNREIESFTGSSETEISNFKESINDRLICKFNDIDAMLAEIRVDMKQLTSDLVNEAVKNGTITVSVTYNPATEELNIVPVGGV